MIKMVKRSRAGKVNNPIEQERMSKYFNANTNNIRDLANAFKQDDIASMKGILHDNTTTGFIGNLYGVYDAEFKEGIVKTILKKNSKYLTKEDQETEFKDKLKPKYQI